MSEIDRICPVVGKTYVDDEGYKLKCIYKLEGDKEYPFVFVHVRDDGYEHVIPCFSNSGRSQRNGRLVRESGLYDDFKIDEPVMVRDSIHHSWERRYFAGISACGKPMTYSYGGTKWSTGNCPNLMWNECRKPTKEEMED